MTILTRRAMLAVVAAAALLAGTGAAVAQSLDEARAQGLVGERLDGYLAVLGGGGAVQALVDSVNARRRQVYEETAASSGQPLSVVQQIAADRIVREQLSSGMYYMNPSGQWVRK